MRNITAYQSDGNHQTDRCGVQSENPQWGEGRRRAVPHRCPSGGGSPQRSSQTSSIGCIAPHTVSGGFITDVWYAVT